MTQTSSSAKLDKCTTGFRLTEDRISLPELPLPKAVGFVPAPPDLPDRVLSILTAIIVRIADIGVGRMLLGVMREREEPVEDQIIYGCSLDAAQLRAVENSLGRCLDQVFEEGRTISSTCEMGRSGGWKRLVWLNDIWRDPNLRVLPQDLARIFHSRIEERSGVGVTRLVIIEPNETAHHRFFFDRV